jgi:hypothetical protein
VRFGLWRPALARVWAEHVDLRGVFGAIFGCSATVGAMLVFPDRHQIQADGHGDR